ncbi:MAG TPA: tetratricopeptide repeat protein [Gaiellaceae bacterium]|nr:tetratricopeptide repeat protein [Gaiellaceae bacterium]
MSGRPFAVTRLDDLERLEGELVTLPVRLRFGIESFGVNAYEAGESGRVIEEHDELGAGAGRHEELYLVARGHALFTLDGKDVDAPEGTFVFVSDPAVRRGAVAAPDAPGTVVLVVGGVPGKPFSPSPWEAWLEAAPHLKAGEPERGVEVLERALAAHPGNPNLLYNLACFESLAGMTDSALAHLSEAIAAEPRAHTWAESDSDFDPIRVDPRFPKSS